MDSFEWNKVLGAVLGTLLVVVALKLGSMMLYEVPEPAKPGYVVPGVVVTTATSTSSSASEAEVIPDWGTVLPKADVAHGKTISVACEQCHDLSKGGPNKIGPNLWNIVNRARATHPGYDYSSAMSSSHDPWTYSKLFVYLNSPQAVVPGTKMSFAGVKNAQDRVDLIAYLRTLADSPAAIPAPAPKAAAAPAKAATATAPGTAGASTASAAPPPGVAPAAGTAGNLEQELAKADVASGKQTSQQCQMCHNLEKGGPNQIGPNLWDVVNRPRATHPNYDYSTAMKANHDPWTYEKLYDYLKSPQTMVPGTKMTFAGISGTQQRINLIAYLRTLSDHPAPLAGSSAAPAGKGG